MDKWKKKFYGYFTVGLIILLIDQITKYLALTHNGTLIPGILAITTVENRGGAFGIGQNNTVTFILTNLIVIGIILRFMIIQKEEMDLKTGIVLSSIIGGGLGNLTDRMFRGYVVDFIDFTSIVPFPVFNIADICIVGGILLLAIFFGMYSYKKKKGRSVEKKVEKD